MPTFDDEILSFMPSGFKASKRASKVSKVDAPQRREAAIRRRLGIDQSTDRYQINLTAIYENLEAGKYPTNDQLCLGLQRLSDLISQKKFIRTTPLKKQEEDMTNNLLELLDATQNFIREKNSQSLVQRFLYHLQLGSKSFPATDTGTKIKDLMTDRSFLEKGKEFMILLITSADFRDLISKLGETVSQIFSRNAEEADQTSKENVQRDQIDQDKTKLENQDIVLQFLNLMNEISLDKDYYEALDFFISCVRKSQREMKEMVKSKSSSMDTDTRIDSNFVHAKKELLEILENVAGHSLKEAQHELSEITKKLKEDYTLRSILDELMTFLERSLRDEEFRRDPDTVLAGCDLIDHSRIYATSSCGENIGNLLKNLKEFLKDLQDDSIVQKLSQSFTSFLDNFYYRVGDRMILNQELLSDLMLNILPNLLNQIRTIRIPRIKAANAKYNFQLDLVEIALDDILPSYFEYKISHGIIMGIRDQITDQKYSSLCIVLHELHLDISSVPFSYKVNAPRIQDRGTLDLQTLKTGISLRLKLHYYPQDSKKTLEIEKSDVYIDKINLKIHGMRHSILYYVAGPIIKNLIRSQFTSSLQLKIQEFVAKMDMIVTARKVQYTRSKSVIGRPMQQDQSSFIKTVPSSTKESRSHHEMYPWETNVFDLVYT